MTFQFNGLNAQVTISGVVQTGLNQPASNQTIRNYSSISTALTTNYQTFLTPTAGKIFYLTDIILCHSSAQVFLSDNGTEFLNVQESNGTSITPTIINLKTPIPIVTALQMKSNGSNTIGASLIGFEA